jgi:PAS domain S-box-containing protein
MVAVEGTTHIIRYVNTAFERLIGKGKTELIGHTFYEAVPESDENICRSLLDRVLHTGQPEILLEQKQKQPHASLVYWSFWVWPILDVEGRPGGVMIQITEATEIANYRQHMTAINESLMLSSIRQHELGETLARTVEELEKTKAELEIRVRERTAELETAVEELRRSNDDLEKFAYISSHDLLEPLRMVSIYIGLLSERYKDKFDDEGRTFFSFGEEGTTRMRRLIKDILEYSRINLQGQAIEPTDANIAVEQALSNLEPTIRETRAQITVASLPIVMAVETQLMRVFQNLISNSLKYRKETEPPHIRIDVKAQDGNWLFSVQDNGIGFDVSYHDLIFMAFKRLHPHRERYPGSGIGLAIVKRIIEQHGGKVWAKSVPDQGSTFYFTLPAAPSTPCKTGLYEMEKG